MSIYKPNNFYPYMQEVDMESLDGNIFSCQTNTDGGFVSAANLKILSTDNVLLYENLYQMENILRNNSLNTVIKNPVKNGDMVYMDVFPYQIYPEKYTNFNIQDNVYLNVQTNENGEPLVDDNGNTLLNEDENNYRRYYKEYNSDTKIWIDEVNSPSDDFSIYNDIKTDSSVLVYKKSNENETTIGPYEEYNISDNINNIYCKINGFSPNNIRLKKNNSDIWYQGEYNNNIAFVVKNEGETKSNTYYYMACDVYDYCNNVNIGNTTDIDFFMSCIDKVYRIDTLLQDNPYHNPHYRWDSSTINNVYKMKHSDNNFDFDLSFISIENDKYYLNVVTYKKNSWKRIKYYNPKDGTSYSSYSKYNYFFVTELVETIEKYEIFFIEKESYSSTNKVVLKNINFVSLYQGNAYNKDLCPYNLFEQKIKNSFYFKILYKSKTNKSDDVLDSMSLNILEISENSNGFTLVLDNFYNVDIDNNDFYICLINNHDYVWNVRLYEHYFGESFNNGTFVTDGYVTGTTDTVVWYDNDKTSKDDKEKEKELKKEQYLEAVFTCNNSNLFSEQKEIGLKDNGNIHVNEKLIIYEESQYENFIKNLNEKDISIVQKHIPNKYNNINEITQDYLIPSNWNLDKNMDYLYLNNFTLSKSIDSSWKFVNDYELIIENNSLKINLEKAWIDFDSIVYKQKDDSKNIQDGDIKKYPFYLSKSGLCVVAKKTTEQNTEKLSIDDIYEGFIGIINGEYYNIYIVRAVDSFNKNNYIIDDVNFSKSYFEYLDDNNNRRNHVSLECIYEYRGNTESLKNINISDIFLDNQYNAFKIFGNSLSPHLYVLDFFDYYDTSIYEEIKDNEDILQELNSTNFNQSDIVELLPEWTSQSLLDKGYICQASKTGKYNNDKIFAEQGDLFIIDDIIGVDNNKYYKWIHLPVRMGSVLSDYIGKASYNDYQDIKDSTVLSLDFSTPIYYDYEIDKNKEYDLYGFIFNTSTERTEKQALSNYRNSLKIQIYERDNILKSKNIDIDTSGYPIYQVANNNQSVKLKLIKNSDESYEWKIFYDNATHVREGYADVNNYKIKEAVNLKTDKKVNYNNIYSIDCNLLQDFKNPVCRIYINSEYHIHSKNLYYSGEPSYSSEFTTHYIGLQLLEKKKEDEKIYSLLIENESVDFQDNVENIFFYISDTFNKTSVDNIYTELDYKILSNTNMIKIKSYNKFENCITLEDEEYANSLCNYIKAYGSVKYYIVYKQREKITWLNQDLGLNQNINKIELSNGLKFNLKDGSYVNIYNGPDENTYNSFFGVKDSDLNLENTYIRFPGYVGKDASNNDIKDNKDYYTKDSYNGSESLTIYRKSGAEFSSIGEYVGTIKGNFYQDNIYSSQSDDGLITSETSCPISLYGKRVGERAFKEEKTDDGELTSYCKLFKVVSYNYETGEFVIAGGLNRKILSSDKYEVWQKDSTLESSNNKYDITEVNSTYTRIYPAPEDYDALYPNAGGEPLFKDGLCVMNSNENRIFIQPNANFSSDKCNYPYLILDNSFDRLNFPYSCIRHSLSLNIIDNTIEKLDDSQWILNYTCLDKPKINPGMTYNLYTDWMDSSPSSYFYARDLGELDMYYGEYSYIVDQLNNNTSITPLTYNDFKKKFHNFHDLKMGSVSKIKTMDAYFMAHFYYSNAKIYRYRYKIYNEDMTLFKDSDWIYSNSLEYGVRGFDNQKTYFLEFVCEDEYRYEYKYEKTFFVEYAVNNIDNMDIKLSNICSNGAVQIDINDLSQFNLMFDDNIDIYRKENNNMIWIKTLNLTTDKIYTDKDFINHKYGFIDYGVSNNKQYEYIFVITKKDLTEDNNLADMQYSIYTTSWRTAFDSWTLVDIVQNDDNIYEVSGNVWSFKYNLESSQITQNLSIATWNTLGKYASVGYGPQNYDSSDFTCLLGEIGTYYTYSNDMMVEKYGYYEDINLDTKQGKDICFNNIERYKQWRKFCNNGNMKLLKDLKGNKWIVGIKDNPTTDIIDKSREQIATISFSWTEIMNSDNISIIDYLYSYDENLDVSDIKLSDEE